MASTSFKLLENPPWIHYMGDSSFARFHDMYDEKSQSGVDGYRIRVEPTKRIIRINRLIKGLRLNEDGTVWVWYPKTDVFQPVSNIEDKKWLFVASSFNGTNRVFIPKITEMSRLIFNLQNDNEKLREENFNLNLRINDLSGKAGKTFSEFAEMFGKMKKVMGTPGDEVDEKEESEEGG